MIDFFEELDYIRWN